MEVQSQLAKKVTTYKFKQSVHIRPKGKPGKNFPCGISQVSEEYEYDPYFLKLVAAGLIEEIDPAKLPVQKTSKEVAEALHQKLVHRKRSKEGPAMANRAALAEKEAKAEAAKVAEAAEVVSVDESEDDVGDFKSSPSDKKHRKAK